MQQDSIFDVASVTKVVCTATAAGICKDRGLLDPDAPMTKYLPDHQGKDVDQISLRRLASHTSGFAENPRVSREGRFKGDVVFAQMLKDNPKWPVNTHYEYACRNIIYLSTIVERVSGRGFGEFCQGEIFEPLEMRDSVFNRVEPSPRVVATHEGDHCQSHNPDTIHAGRAIGNAGLFTTAGDLSNFCQMMLGDGQWRGKRILSPETIADFTRNNQAPQFPGRGFIWETDLKSDHRPARMSDKAYGHSGFTGISVWIDPEKCVYTIVMTNRNHPEKVGKQTNRGMEQYKARGRIADTALEALGY
jgi:CubicO group peptidase (beta-lactamase class C family)